MLSKEFHFMLLKSFQYSNRYIMKEANSLGLFSGQPKILEYLLENNGAKSMEIASGCALDRSTVASLLLRMEKMGFIDKRIDLEDRRSFDIFLTERGKEKAKMIKNAVGKVDEFAFKGLSEEERIFF